MTIALADADGAPVYAQTDDRRVTVRVSGAGTLAGIGNGNPRDAASFQSGVRLTFHGRVVTVIRAGVRPGPIDVDVETEGLPAQHLRLNAVSR
ncbi:MAG: hypothetical protein ACXU8U_00095 [Asticcacaulis sp.]